MPEQEVTCCSATYPAVTEHCEHIGRALARITDKWTMLVIRLLRRGPRRFNALQREIGQISQKVLASTLRDLEMNGLVSRTVTTTKPLRVEYALTPLGQEFSRPARALAEWVIANQDQIEEARAAYSEQA